MERNYMGRQILRGPRGGEYVLGPDGSKIRPVHRVPPRAITSRLAKLLKISNEYYVDKKGQVYNHLATPKKLGPGSTNMILTSAFMMNPKFLLQKVIPYIGTGTPNQAFMNKHRLANGLTSVVPNNGSFHKKVYFNRKGNLYYLSLDGKKHGTHASSTRAKYKMNERTVRLFKRTIGQRTMMYPRRAIPPASPSIRTSPELLNNMMNQIYGGGRGTNINAGRYTNTERNVLARRLGNSIQYFKTHRNAKKDEAAKTRVLLRRSRVAGARQDALKKKIANAEERVGYYDDAVRAYTRGLRAVKPLTGIVTPRARAMAATANRFTPAPASVNENAIYMPLNKPHLVVKTPGVGVIYLNPNTFRGFVKNAARVNIPEANVRNWLRMARRNFPNEPLFRHPLATARNVTPSHIRFSRT
jgi:hypothetical protein